MQGFLLTGAVARALGVSERTVMNWADRGRLRTVRAGRVRLFDAKQVERLARRRGPNAQSNSKSRAAEASTRP